MSTPFLGLRTTIYPVSNLEAAKLWYNRVLSITPYFDEPFYVGYNVAGYELGLIPTKQDSPTTAPTSVTYWGVDNVHETYDMLLEAGAATLEEPHDVGDNIIVAAVSDPWGNAFGIIFNPHFKL